MIVVVVTEFVSGEPDKVNCDWHQEESSFVFSRQHCSLDKSPTFSGIWNTLGTL